MARAIKGASFQPLALRKADLALAVEALRSKLQYHACEAKRLGAAEVFDGIVYGEHKDKVRHCAQVIAKMLCLAQEAKG